MLILYHHLTPSFIAEFSEITSFFKLWALVCVVTEQIFLKHLNNNVLIMFVIYIYIYIYTRYVTQDVWNRLTTLHKNLQQVLPFYGSQQLDTRTMINLPWDCCTSIIVYFPLSAFQKQRIIYISSKPQMSVRFERWQ